MESIKQQVQEQIKSTGTIHLNARLQALTELLEEIETEGYETFSQLRGAIISSAEILKKLKAKQDEGK